MYSKKLVFYADMSLDHRNHKGDDMVTTGLSAERTAALKKDHTKDLKIDDCIPNFLKQLKSEHVYRIRYFTDLGKINFSAKIDYRTKLHLKTDMKRLFESQKLLASGSTIPTPNVKIIFAKAAFIQYKQILLDKNFRQYLETLMVTQKTPLQKTYEISTGQDSIDIEFLGANRQFDWLEIFLVYDKSNKHTRIYDSYNHEVAAKTIKSIKLSNFTEIYRLKKEKIIC